MIFIHSIQRHIEKSDPSGSAVLKMYYNDIRDIAHILWRCKEKGMLEDENEKMLQLEFQSLRHLIDDGVTCDPFEICSIHDELEKMGCGDEKQGFNNWHDLSQNADDLPPEGKTVLVKLKDDTYRTSIYKDGKWSRISTINIVKWKDIE